MLKNISAITLKIAYPITPKKLMCPIVENRKILSDIMNINETKRTVLTRKLSFCETGFSVRNEDSSDTKNFGMLSSGIDIEAALINTLQYMMGYNGNGKV